MGVSATRKPDMPCRTVWAWHHQSADKSHDEDGCRMRRPYIPLLSLMPQHSATFTSERDSLLTCSSLPSSMAMHIALQQALTCPVVLQAGGTRPHLRVLLRLWPIPFHNAEHLDVSLQQPMSWLPL